MRFDSFKKGVFSWPDPVRKRGNEPRAPGKDAPLEEQLECAAEQEDPNAGLLEYLRAGKAWPEGVGERRALMKLVREEFEK